MAITAKNWRDYTALGNLSARWVFSNLPFVFFIFFLSLIYIANAHFSEKRVRQIQAMEKDIKELRWRYMQQKASVMVDSKQSEVTRMVEPLGLKSSNERTKRIIIPAR